MKKITQELVASWIPHRDQQTYKNKLGHVLCVGGNAEMGGAIILSASAALHAGAGLVTVASAPENRPSLHASTPEVMFIEMYEEKALIKAIHASSTILLGPGLGRTQASRTVFQTVLNQVKNDQWLILDADALTLYAELDSNTRIKKDNLILTPHLGEWERLSSIHPPANNVKENKKSVKKLHSHVVLKKARTEVYLDHEVWINTAGNPSMATGGMGDTLAGIIAGLLGQFTNKKQALLSAVYLHSAIADELAKTHYVTLPSLISHYLPTFMKKLQNDQ